MLDKYVAMTLTHPHTVTVVQYSNYYTQHRVLFTLTLFPRTHAQGVK